MVLVQKTIKNIYLGEPWGAEEFFNYQTLSLSELQSKWWLSWWYIALDSTRWAYSTQDGSWQLWCPIDLSNADIITVTRKIQWWNNSRCWWPWFWLCKDTLTWDIAQMTIWWSSNFNNNNNYRDQNYYVNWSKKYWNQQNLGSWEYDIVLTVNFTTNETSFQVWTAYTYNYTMDSTECDAVKSSNYIVTNINYNGSTQFRCYSMGYKTEKI